MNEAIISVRDNQITTTGADQRATLEMANSTIGTTQEMIENGIPCVFVEVKEI